MIAQSDVVIAGAGPAGSALAIALARTGVRVTLVERAAFPRVKPCADYLGPEALRRLDRLGVLPQVEAVGFPVEGTTVLGPHGSRLSGALAEASRTYSPFRPTGLAVPRTTLDALLAEAAVRAGARLLERTAVIDLERRGRTVTGVIVQHQGGLRETIEARATVGADGLRSIVSRRAGLFRASYPARLAFVTYVDGIRGLSGRVELHVGERAYFGVNRVGTERGNVALVVPRHLARAARGEPISFFNRHLADFPSLAERLPTLDRNHPLTVTGPFAVRARRVARDGLALVGDAAEFFDPFTGEGVYGALTGAAHLAESLEAALHTGETTVTARQLLPYTRAHRRIFRGKRMVERMIGYGMLLPRLFDRAVDRLDRRGLAPTLLGVTGDFIPPHAVLNPAFLASMIL